uniref:AMP_N domain-containing protein n=1 Tax=Macrostomum lignano TaxID=282301 RepID=A0A1I8HGG2_9PLAT
MKRCTADILKALRQLMSRHQLNAYLVPSEDAHMSEYVADCDKRRAQLTGFTGSAGTALVTESEALMWTDGRYFLQAEQQMDSNWTLMRALAKDVPTLTEYLANRGSPGLAAGGTELVGLPDNLVDAAWTVRPERPLGRRLFLLTAEEAGAGPAEKLALLRQEMQKCKAGLLILSALDDVAWLFNYRAVGVIPMSPVLFAYAAVTPDSAHLFADLHESALAEFKQHVAETGVQLHAYAKFQSELEKLVAGSSGRVWLDHRASAAVGLPVPKARVYTANSPASVLKAVKYAPERAGMARAHVLDAVALCRYLHWLELQLAAGSPVTELSGSNQLDQLRSEMEGFVEISFETISGSGSNGAIIHYRVTPETDRPIVPDEAYLVRHNRRHPHGVLRRGAGRPAEAALHPGAAGPHRPLPPHLPRERALGSRLDTHARAALWTAGLEFQHGTGHGVGVFLNVHEGPCAISGSRANPHEIGLKRGMIVTIEPGFYLAGQYGIRVENVVEVVPQPG